MTTTAWVFPGQGSQKIGMQGDLVKNPAALAKLEKAEEILKWSILEVCEKDEEKLSRTRYTQPCLYAIEAILVDLLLEAGQTPQYLAGHSLGEYVALYAAGVYDFEAGLRLVKRRGELMDEAEGGKMYALMGFDRDQLQGEINRTPNVVLANDNSAGQVVISGEPKAVDTIVAAVKTKRAIELNVSGAFHSHFMKSASEQFNEILATVEFNEAKIPVLSNVEPIPTTNAGELKTRLQQQMTGSVRWREIMDAIAANKVEQIVEVGPGKVLAGLFKRAYSKLPRLNVDSMAALPKG
ncbi:MAG: ACP S-malonyltransferase [Cyanobacteria bacterium SBLK]|nr:ACP S-malonyltransferase [Cyanobacteria bacterium SBLK]